MNKRFLQDSYTVKCALVNIISFVIVLCLFAKFGVVVLIGCAFGMLCMINTQYYALKIAELDEDDYITKADKARNRADKVIDPIVDCIAEDLFKQIKEASKNGLYSLTSDVVVKHTATSLDVIIVKLKTLLENEGVDTSVKRIPGGPQISVVMNWRSITNNDSRN